MSSKDIRHVVVVYQHGKVASTSIVNSLNRVKGVRGLQSHFLGRDALRSIVDALIDPSQSDYFQRHRLGQFLTNLEITREIQGFKAGLFPDRSLTIITLTREPLDWFRSSLSQDIMGYLPTLRRCAEARGISADTDEALVRKVLPAILQHLHDRFRSIGGIDAFFVAGRPFRTLFDSVDAHYRNGLIEIACVFVRPYSWLEDHLERFLLVRVQNFFQLKPEILWKDLRWAGVYVIRYEDLPKAMRFVASRLELQGFALGRDNVSDNKLLAREIKAAFASEPALQLRELCQQTAFHRAFYGEPERIRPKELAVKTPPLERLAGGSGPGAA